jgi:hypothetical protein
MRKHVAIPPEEGADRLAIRELVEAYAHCADRRDAKGQMALFTSAGGASAASGETVFSSSSRRPKKRGPFQFVPVMARAMVERLA